MAWHKSRPGDLADRLSSYSCIPTSPSSSLPRHTATENTHIPRQSRSQRDSLIVLGSRSGCRNPLASSSSMSGSSTVPSLSQASSSSTTTRSPSIDAGQAGKLGVHHILQEDGNGILIAPPHARVSVARYDCLFHILDCKTMLDDIADWKTHVLSHFRTHPPPTSARCPLCPYTSSAPQRGVSWAQMLEHIAEKHLLQGQSLATTTPDLELMRYLYCKNIISGQQMRLVQLPSAPGRVGYTPAQDTVRESVGSSDDPCYTHASQRLERREGRVRDRQPRVGVAGA
ncbi:hypothetical protein AJ80_05799 [Polytolypa hystricis UAMH7299]|uniref:Uncharacterized protein n=1 Tax=Polytolypa hystricis (strain UAMH7299) TaxID=1447883 RepID=A0A2B7Y0N6_POLH7|nr:hypothetical protein AJ80_05799 [Polytolypa hystricis UAMH7299]